MKSYIFTAIILLNVAYQKCTRNPEPPIPACIQAKIEEIKSQPRWNPPAEVHEYRQEGRSVFLFSADCCDNFNTVYDAQCRYICAPSGGIAGSGDRKCEDFTEKTQYVGLVWKDPR